MSFDSGRMLELLSSALSEWDVTLDSKQEGQICRYASLLIQWNEERYNLTRLTSPEQVAIQLFLDSYALFQVAGLPIGAALLDIGTGAGFPGLALKLFRPDLHVVLLEATAKKLAFCKEVGAELKMTGIHYIHGRAEQEKPKDMMRTRFDVITARAVAPLDTLLTWCAPWLHSRATLVAWKGPGVADEVVQAHQTVVRLRLALQVKYLILPHSGDPPISRSFVICRRKN